MFRVVANEAESNIMDLDCGLLQGSSLGPLKWIIYTAELRDIVNHHGISFHGFADDSVLGKSKFVCDIQTGKRAMLCGIAVVEAWCRYRGLKLNADKSEVLWLGARQQRDRRMKTWSSPLGLCRLQDFKTVTSHAFDRQTDGRTDKQTAFS